MPEPTPENIETVTGDIARQLDESNPDAIRQIRLIVRHMGPDAAYEVLKEALAVEAQGGMMTLNKTRRRTPGGVFFYLVRGKLSYRERHIIWTDPRKRQSDNKKKHNSPS